MNKTTMILFVILLIAIVSLSMPTKCVKNKEGFYTFGSYPQQYCSSCGYLGRGECNNCVNCGYSINASGYGQCIPGDSNGPYFSLDTMIWEYNRPYIYPSRGIYPIVKSKPIYPHNKYWIKKYGKWRKH